MEIALSLVSSVVGVLAGSAVTYYVSKKFYRKSSDDLDKSIEELRRIADFFMLAMNKGYTFERNEKGEIVGLSIKFDAPVAIGKVTMQPVVVTTDERKP